MQAMPERLHWARLPPRFSIVHVRQKIAPLCPQLDHCLSLWLGIDAPITAKDKVHPVIVFGSDISRLVGFFPILPVCSQKTVATAATSGARYAAQEKGVNFAGANEPKRTPQP